MKKSLLILISLLSLNGCLSTDDSSNDLGYDNVHSNTTYGEKADTAVTNSDYDYDIDSGKEEKNPSTSDKLTLEAKVTNIINPTQGFKFSSVPIEGSTITCTITDRMLIVDMQEHGWIWRSTFDIIGDFKGEVFPGYTIYSSPVKNALGGISNVELKIHKTNTLEYLIIDGRTFSNNHLKINSTKNTSPSLSLVKELEPGTVEIREGETLRIIVGKYNKQFNTNFTIEEIKKYNNLSSNTLRVGDTLKFPQQ